MRDNSVCVRLIAILSGLFLACNDSGTYTGLYSLGNELVRYDFIKNGLVNHPYYSSFLLSFFLKLFTPTESSSPMS